MLSKLDKLCYRADAHQAEAQIVAKYLYQARSGAVGRQRDSVPGHRQARVAAAGRRAAPFSLDVPAKCGKCACCTDLTPTIRRHWRRHLDDEAFVAALGVSKDEFTKLPAWRQLNLKKRASLF